MALVGRSGSGKSTVVSLLQRFYEPGSGAVLLDGMDIRTLDLAWLRRQVCCVCARPGGWLAARAGDRQPGTGCGVQAARA
jgi:ABC-type transport system involved in cytochrome bd biosynthesis fused ATPase/permease subunit